ncbi:two component transcriptional regulator, LytTR family [Pustulibacterium marinum]|uniref:Two component transcriptional regulator, LytTR family n=1 Tax=Pustulibacterium marinum TaxID=1224947 RepID=A0A1I7GPA7_9FLAO|nr:LytTR family DNA-binding domain-containing protein [Pustulibacterium marinum]SFU50288.1 two component transcriptional regulator, LytTR family [Pustulibacterium marinum]
MKCVIIDDEPLAIDVIKSYCERMDFLEVIGVFTNAIDAHSLLNTEQVDLIFLDIEMPQINGIDFINSITNKPLFIFTTAYSDYAVEGFELNAVDYLMKPIPYHRFVKSVLRAKEIMNFKNNQITSLMNTFPAFGSTTEEPKLIFLKSDYENVRVDVNDIKYVQGLKDYLKVNLESTRKSIITLSNFKDISEKLPKHNFVRIHKSYLVNIHHIKSVQKSRVVIGEEKIPIGESFRNDFFKRLGI